MAIPQTLGCRQIVGLPVRNLQDQALGRIHELRIDVISGRVAYAVLATDSPEGGAKYFAVPWSSLQIDPQQGSLRLDVDAQRLYSSPGLTEEEWKPHDEPSWHESVHRYFGIKPYWEATEHYTA